MQTLYLISFGIASVPNYGLPFDTAPMHPGCSHIWRRISSHRNLLPISTAATDWTKVQFRGLKRDTRYSAGMSNLHERKVELGRQGEEHHQTDDVIAGRDEGASGQGRVNIHAIQ